MKVINIVTPGGFGDAFTYSSVIKNKYAKEYDQVFIDCPRVAGMNKVLYNDTPNANPGKAPNGSENIRLRWQDCVAHWESWRTVDWNRELDKEQECYDYFTNKYGKDYIIVHWRGRDNMGGGMKPLNPEYFINKDIPMINLDADWLRQNGDPIHGVLDYRMLIENAKEIHMYEGNWSSMVAGLQNIQHIPFFLHLYCKPDLFKWQNHRSDVLRFISEGKWMKDNVDIRYVYDYEYPSGLKYDFSKIEKR